MSIEAPTRLDTNASNLIYTPSKTHHNLTPSIPSYPPTTTCNPTILHIASFLPLPPSTYTNPATLATPILPSLYTTLLLPCNNLPYILL